MVLLLIKWFLYFNITDNQSVTTLDKLDILVYTDRAES